MVGHAYLNTWEVQAGGSEVQGHSQLHRKSEASLGYMRLFLKEKKNSLESEMPPFTYCA